MFKLGQKVKDKITRFTGIITGHADYITGCDQYLVTPPAVKGEHKESRWFDEGRLQAVGTELAFTPEDVKSKKNGAGEPAPVK